MKTIVLDIDGVLADFESRLVEELYRDFGNAGRVNRHLYRFEDRFEDRPEILDRALELTNNPNFYYALPEIPEGIRFLEDLLDQYKIIYATSRPVASYSFTHRWLIKHTTDIEPHLVCGAGDKAKFLVPLKDEIEFVVDDSPDQISRIRAAGMIAVCWEQPWNENVFPRLYTRSDGEVMLWADPSIEAEPFFETEGVTNE